MFKYMSCAITVFVQVGASHHHLAILVGTIVVLSRIRLLTESCSVVACSNCMVQRVLAELPPIRSVLIDEICKSDLATIS